MAGTSFRLDGDVALVTGGASGIGQAIALGIAEAGGKVAVADLANADFESTLGQIASIGGSAIAVPVDVTDKAQLVAAVEKTEAELGALTLAVNSAGIANAAPALEMSQEQWQQVYDVDVTGVFLSCQVEGAAMLRHGRGSIVNIASMSGTIVNRGLLQVHYNSAKAAVQHLTKSLAMEWAREGVRVNSISPGYTATPMNTRPEVADQAIQFAADTPLGRMAAPAEIAGPTVFLLSPAASFCTGVDLLVDGGFCCW
ncbi:SDR family oxidoreductase [Isoptericola sp. b441]|uniref:SDR family oxidoreductase n=1 Tax=Actinotalea lenta TaxID=3064654 RepID=A0ABT9D8F9_9CELL|nr:SDR family oxidoreductase [Isoptericola sp. b441]MDO8107182.1 SDR family oxidoreductase [Isoptericola sp. b441]